MSAGGDSWQIVAGRLRGMERTAVIFDVDGTLVDVSGVRHYVTDDPRRKNFEKFHAAASYCRPIESTRVLAELVHAAGARVFIVTARKERWRYATTVWLRKWGIEYEALLMRPDADDRRDVEVKRDILALIRSHYGAEPALAVDDNPAVIALWEEERIPTIVVPGWDHDAAEASALMRQVRQWHEGDRS